jgi:hypothetical protein
VSAGDPVATALSGKVSDIAGEVDVSSYVQVTGPACPRRDQRSPTTCPAGKCEGSTAAMADLVVQGDDAPSMISWDIH